MKNQGSLKRCGGIGDILTGIISAYLSSFKKSNTEYFSSEENSKHLSTEINKKISLICVLSCFICREAARLAFINKGISLTAPDVIKKLENGKVFSKNKIVYKNINPILLKKYNCL